MILADTSVWIDHLRKSDHELTRLLNDNRVCIHPFVTGELALGSLKNRGELLDALQDLTPVCVAMDREVMHFINQHELYGFGIGYVDAHLLAATRLTDNCRIWTRDKRLHAASVRLGLAAHTHH